MQGKRKAEETSMAAQKRSKNKRINRRKNEDHQESVFIDDLKL